MANSKEISNSSLLSIREISILPDESTGFNINGNSNLVSDSFASIAHVKTFALGQLNPYFNRNFLNKSFSLNINTDSYEFDGKFNSFPTYAAVIAAVSAAKATIPSIFFFLAMSKIAPLSVVLTQ